MFNFLPSGESLQQIGTNTETNQNKPSFNQQWGPMQVPISSASPVQQDEAVGEKGPRPSSASGHCSDKTPATTDPDNKDLGKAEEITTGVVEVGSAAVSNALERAETGERFVEGGSAAVTNTPERAEMGERQGEDIASEVKELITTSTFNFT